MTEQKINSEFCFDSNKKLTIEISHKALKNYSDKFQEALNLQKSIPIILDTNVLLAYYGMSQSEKESLIKFLDENKDRIFLTFQIEKEFLKNRISVINDDFFTPLNNIQSGFHKTYKEIKDTFKSFIETKKNILSKDYPEIWSLLSEKQEKLNEILADEQSLSQIIGKAIETTTKDYKDIYVVDKLLEVCANFQITPPLSDEEVEFVKNQYEELRQKYEAAGDLQKKEIIFPGCGDRSRKDYPYGDFIIFHEILKFMVSGKDVSNKTDVIFVTWEKSKGDWIRKDLTAITHYIEKAFLVTDKTLFIIHAEKLLKISFENIYKSDPEEFPPKVWLENKLYTIRKNPEKDRLIFEVCMGHYRGWTIIISLVSVDKGWISIAINTLCYSYAEFIESSNDNNIAATFLRESLPTKEETYIAIKSEVDLILEQTRINNNVL